MTVAELPAQDEKTQRIKQVVKKLTTKRKVKAHSKSYDGRCPRFQRYLETTTTKEEAFKLLFLCNLYDHWLASTILQVLRKNLRVAKFNKENRGKNNLEIEMSKVFVDATPEALAELIEHVQTLVDEEAKVFYPKSRKNRKVIEGAKIVKDYAFIENVIIPMLADSEDVWNCLIKQAGVREIEKTVTEQDGTVRPATKWERIGYKNLRAMAQAIHAIINSRFGMVSHEASYNKGTGPELLNKLRQDLPKLLAKEVTREQILGVLNEVAGKPEEKAVVIDGKTIPYDMLRNRKVRRPIMEAAVINGFDLDEFLDIEEAIKTSRRV